MRWSIYLGVGLIISGAILVAVSSGAFDATLADRGVEIETASDDDALLGLNYSTSDRTVTLESGDSNGGGFCLFGGCSSYRYNDRKAVLLEDNAPSGELTMETLSVNFQGPDMTRRNGVRYDQTPNGIRIVLGDFSCPAEGDWGFGDQQQQSGTIIVDGVFSDGTVTVGLEREIDVECVPD
ncbi:hypothetical protein A6E15_00475 [Natrinema saccharevitans]|uniref:Uncharacterized protein n=1 Tax=Natrinema saccharevitans TaxID=301967 RepID=A0A1S8ASQ5_9EURY|nr:hypothetical protein [Natrinema saccharevitans]OLZ39549.1 hypothetical protein A6E15_00475 [Natrinema saccharevitans]